jgi:hypothetical protein
MLMMTCIQLNRLLKRDKHRRTLTLKMVSQTGVDEISSNLLVPWKLMGGKIQFPLSNVQRSYLLLAGRMVTTFWLQIFKKKPRKKPSGTGSYSRRNASSWPVCYFGTLVL